MPETSASAVDSRLHSGIAESPTPDGSETGAGEATIASPDIKLTASWGGKKFVIYAPPTITLTDLKRKLHDVTHVDPKRQKLLGLVKGKIPSDEYRLSDCNIKEDHKFVLMGTVEAGIPKEPEEIPEVIDDFDSEDFRTTVDPTVDPDNTKKLQDASEYATLYRTLTKKLN
ncbi:Ubiquitin-like domain-containing CTD phosphatase 1, partial [Gonapodya sp. JEL0774]